jgi:[ribosomal protein S5]-alanine N-acetyltransferase
MLLNRHAFAAVGSIYKVAPMTFSVVPCDQDGQPTEVIPNMPAALVANCQATAELYRRVGFSPPWIGYVAVVDNRGVGGGAFVGPPKDGRVEIAYFTLEDEQRKGYAAQTAAALVAVARDHDPDIGLKAFTLKEENASTKILRALGFSVVGVAQDPDAGEVWEWRA